MAKKAALGRGLGALFGDDTMESIDEQGASPLREIELTRIWVNPDQPRRKFSEEELQELADSVRADGVLQPIVVREVEDGFQIVAGERRFHAAKIAGLTTIPAVVREVSDNELLRLALIENLQRQDLTPLEAARGYRTLMEQDRLTQDEVGRLLSKSRPAIANALRLLELPEGVQELLEAAQITAGHARAILRVEGDEARLALANKVVEEGLSVRETENLAPSFSVSEGAPAEETSETANRRVRPAVPETFKDAARRLGGRLETKVAVRTVRGHNRIEIEFSDEEELSTLVERILVAGTSELRK